MALETEHPAVVGALGVVLYEAQSSSELLDPSRVRWAFGCVKLSDGGALTD